MAEVQDKVMTMQEFESMEFDCNVCNKKVKAGEAIYNGPPGKSIELITIAKKRVMVYFNGSQKFLAHPDCFTKQEKKQHA